MMNREQRRAQLKALGKKIKGLEITNGVVQWPINKNEKLPIDLMDFGVVYHITKICDDFVDVKATYAEDFERINALADERKQMVATVELYYEKISQDFVGHVEGVFGEGSAVKIFGNKHPGMAQVAEFISGVLPLMEVVMALMKSEVDAAGGNKPERKDDLVAEALGRAGNV